MGFKAGPGGDIGGTKITTTETGSFGAVSVGEQVNPSAPSNGAGGILYSKADGKLYWISNELAETDLTGGSALTQEQVEDFAGALVASGGTKTGITVTYQDGTGDMDFVVADTTVAGDSGTTAMTPGDTLTIAGGTNVTTAMSGDTLTINASGSSGSKQTFCVNIAGRMKIQTTSTDRMYTHSSEMGSANYADWTTLRTDVGDVTNTSFTTTLDQAYFYYTTAVVPFACTAKNFLIALSIKDNTSYDYTAGNDPFFKLWRGRHDNETEDASVTWTRLKDGQQFDTTETEPTVSRKTITSWDEDSLAAGDLIALTFYTGGASISNVNQFVACFTALEN